MELSEPKKIMKVIIYTRVSSQEQIQNYSLETQLKACEEYCKRQEWEIIERFQEEGESAKSADRTELLKLLDYCSRNKGKVDLVLVHKLDRFARNSADHHAIRALLAKNGVAVRSVNEQIDDSPAGKFMENIFAAAAQWDNDVRSERSRNGLKEKAMQGYWAWGAPLGYLNTLTGLVLDKEKAPLILKLFETYSQGNETIKSLTVKVNRWGLRNKHGKKLYAQTVTRMLQNKLYMGIISVPRWNYEGEKLRAQDYRASFIF